MKPTSAALSWLAQVAALSAILLGIGAGIAAWHCGSWQAAAASGRPLFVLPERVDFGIVNHGATLPLTAVPETVNAETEQGWSGACYDDSMQGCLTNTCSGSGCGCNTRCNCTHAL